MEQATAETARSGKSRRGVVVRSSGTQSVVVEVMRIVKHTGVGKRLRRRSTFHVHDPKNSCQIGDEVMIRECRPISKTKNWIFTELIKRPESTPEVAV